MIYFLALADHSKAWNVSDGSDEGRHTVDAELGVSDDLLDLAVCLEIRERFPCERSVNLQTIDEGGNGDETVGLDILLELV